MDNFKELISNSGENVSRETIDQLVSFFGLIQKWNKKINLISKNTTERELANDHFLDCIQLQEIISGKECSILDVGSGGGFPGIVLSILGYKGCEMIEIITKKTIFLKSALHELGLANKVHNMDVQKHSGDYDIIISRAVCSMEQMVEMTHHLSNPSTKYIFLKSKSQRVEIEELSQNWKFELQEIQNKYKTEGTVYILSNLSRDA